MAIKSLRDLLVEELKDIYDAEHQILEALPKMAKAASNPQLRSGLEQHLQETKQQVSRLEQVFKHLNADAERETCEAIEGLVEEGDELMGMNMEPDVLDAALIGAAQKVEHYEISSYGTLRTWAQQLGLGQVAALLEQTLNEEKATDKKLTDLAESRVNPQAKA